MRLIIKHTGDKNMKDISICILVILALILSVLYYKEITKPKTKCLDVQFDWSNTDSITVPPNINLYIPPGYVIYVPADKTLTFEGVLITEVRSK